jgi:hypothetical protein
MPKGINAPLRFDGPKQARDANFATHRWTADNDDEFVCINCDCRYASFVSEWPCGYPVPRTHDLK